MSENAQIVVSSVNKLVSTRFGMMLVNEFDTVVGRSLQAYGTYFDSELEVFSQIIKPGMVVADIGANIGAHTIALARLTGPAGAVIALEPQRIAHQLLCANVALNSFLNVHTLNVGAGAECKYMQSTELDYSKPNNFGGFDISNAKHLANSSSIQIITMDSMFSNTNIGFIKIDVEGHEADVIRGSKNIIEKSRPAMYIENDRQQKSKELLSLISSFGYKTYWHIAPFYNQDNFNRNPEKIHTEGLFLTKEGLMI
ncbi:MAG: hypothetical protein RL154_1002, partial [Pseudomonadota bacterium]